MDPWHAARRNGADVFPAVQARSSGASEGEISLGTNQSLRFFLPWGVGRGEGNGPDESVLAVNADLRAPFLARVKPELLQDAP